MIVSFVTDSIASLEINDGSCAYMFRDGQVERIDASSDLTGIVKWDDILLICTESFTNVMSSDEIEYYLCSSSHPADDLYDRACVNGGPEDMSIIVVKIGGTGFGDCDAPDDDGRWDPYA